MRLSPAALRGGTNRLPLQGPSLALAPLHRLSETADLAAALCTIDLP